MFATFPAGLVIWHTGTPLGVAQQWYIMSRNGEFTCSESAADNAWSAGTHPRSPAAPSRRGQVSGEAEAAKLRHRASIREPCDFFWGRRHHSLPPQSLPIAFVGRSNAGKSA